MKGKKRKKGREKGGESKSEKDRRGRETVGRKEEPERGTKGE